MIIKGLSDKNTTLLRLLSLMFLIVTAGLLPIYMPVFRYGGISGFACDLTDQLIPFIVETKRMIASGVPFWSWNSYLGDNFIGAYSYYTVGNPMALFCCLFPERYLGVAVIIVLYLAAMCTAWTALVYFRRMKLRDDLVLLGALMYAGSTFYIINQFYFIFSMGIMLLPLLLTAIENLIDRRRHSAVRLTVVAAVCVISNYYFAALSFMGAFIYVLLRAGAGYKILLKYCGCVILGICLAGFLFVPTLMAASGTGRLGYFGFSEERPGWVIYSMLIKLYYTFVPRFCEGVATALSLDYCSLSLYVTIFGLAAVCTKMMRWLRWLIIVYFAIWLTPLNYVFSFGQSAYYSRWTYCILIVLILATLKSIEAGRFNRQNILKYCCIAIGLTGLIAVGRAIMMTGPASPKIYEQIELAMMAAGLAIALIWVSTGRSIKFLTYSVAAYSAASFLISSLLLNGVIPTTRLTESAVWLLAKADFNLPSAGDFRYRVDSSVGLHNFSTLNGCPSINYFHSIRNSALTPFLEAIGVKEEPVVLYEADRESAAALLSVNKVIVDTCSSLYNGSDPQAEYRYGLSNPVAAEGYLIYDYDYSLPIGFSYDSYITTDQLLETLDGNSGFDACKAMLCNAVIQPADTARLQGILRRDTIQPDITLEELSGRHRLYAATFKPSTCGFESEIDNTTSHDVLYFYSVPADKGFTARLDGKETPVYNINLGMMGIVVPPGKHCLQLSYIPPGLIPGLIITFAALILTITLSWYGKAKRLRKPNTCAL